MTKGSASEVMIVHTLKLIAHILTPKEVRNEGLLKGKYIEEFIFSTWNYCARVGPSVNQPTRLIEMLIYLSAVSREPGCEQDGLAVYFYCLDTLALQSWGWLLGEHT